MTEHKKSKNPFVNMANEAKKNQQNLGVGKAPKVQGSKINTKGFGNSTIVRRSGRGG